MNIGRWWYKSYEIDLVTYDDISVSYIEVKWTTLTMKDVRRILSKLREKAMRTGIYRDKVYYVVVCRNVKYLDQNILEDNETVITLNDIENRIFGGHTGSNR